VQLKWCESSSTLVGKQRHPTPPCKAAHAWVLCLLIWLGKQDGLLHNRSCTAGL
jgi:hypothetical protein